MYIIFTAIHRIVQSPFLHNGSEAWTGISVIIKFSNLYWLSKKIVGGGGGGFWNTLYTEDFHKCEAIKKMFPEGQR
jgi:hypothetical protein